MRQRRNKFSPNRKVVETPPEPEELRLLADRIGYGGNPQHKRNPGDFGLDPPAQPRRGKTLCDEVSILKRADALALLKSGTLRGMLSAASGAGGAFPAMIWAVTESGLPMEAQLENPSAGTYHGYPMPEPDPFRLEILRLWRERRPAAPREFET